jgi:hypothetical protein
MVATPRGYFDDHDPGVEIRDHRIDFLFSPGPPHRGHSHQGDMGIYDRRHWGDHRVREKRAKIVPDHCVGIQIDDSL